LSKQYFPVLQPLDSALYAIKDSLKKDEIENLFLNNYELSQDLDNLRVTVNFVFENVYKIVEKDEQSRIKFRDELLADLREIEKFIEVRREKNKEEMKKIAKIKQQKALSKIDNTIVGYKNIISNMIKLDNVEMEWYRCQLELEEQRQIAKIILDINITA